MPSPLRHSRHPCESPVGHQIESLPTKVVLYDFIANPKKNDEAARDTKGKADNIDKRKSLVSQEIAQRDKQVIFNHIQGILINDMQPSVRLHFTIPSTW